MMCRHCHRAKASRPKGLCWNCYYAPGVRALYPSTSKYAVRGLGHRLGVPPQPGEPTEAAPGSRAKIRVLRERARRGEALFHPLDERLAIPCSFAIVPMRVFDAPPERDAA